MTRKRLATVQKIIRISLAAAIALFLAVLCFFLPYYVFLPAYRLPQREEGELRLHLLDGVRDCCIVEFPGGNILIVNAGNGSLDSKNRIYRYLKGLNPTAVSVLATDADTSCVGGFSRILQGFPVERAYLPAFSKDKGAYARFTSLLEQKKIPAERISRYRVIADESGAYAVCLSPYREETEQREASVMLWLSYQGVNFLLAGNASASRQHQLFEEYEADSDIFNAGDYTVRLNETHIVKVANHGAASSVSSDLLKTLNVSAALVQCGTGYTLSGSTAQLLASQRLGIYRTDELKNIAVSVKDGTYRILPHFGA